MDGELRARFLTGRATVVDGAHGPAIRDRTGRNPQLGGPKLSKSTSIRLAATLVLCLAGAVVSGLLLAQHHGDPGAVSVVGEVCRDGRTSGCGIVARSAWSKIGGVPLALLGTLFYASLVLLIGLGLVATAQHHRFVARLTLCALGLGLVFDLFLLGLQVFSIHAYCALCITTYILSALAAAMVWAVADPLRRAAMSGDLPAPSRSPDSLDATPPTHGQSPNESRERSLVLAGWVFGTLVLSIGLTAAEVALAEREKAGVLGMIGSAVTSFPSSSPATLSDPAPSSAISATPALSASPPASADAKTTLWQAEAERLQSTLDDPAKLETYFSEKAQREFDVARPEKLALENAPSKGAPNAPVKVVEYSDFLCPGCRNLAAALGNFVPRSGNRVQVFFKSFPLDQSCNATLQNTVHPGACTVALGSICAHRQGKFWPFHDKVFSEQPQSPQTADVLRIAAEAGLDTAAMEACLADPRAKAELSADIAEGNRFEISSTPTVFVNGKRVMRMIDFVQVVEREAMKKGFPPMSRPQGQVRR
jgi:protein-disulfide isomerase/uncharacterized membrane protein